MRIYRISSTGAEARYLLEDSAEPRLVSLLDEFRRHVSSDLWKPQIPRYNGFMPPTLVDHLLEWVRPHEFLVPLSHSQVRSIQNTIDLEHVEIEL